MTAFLQKLAPYLSGTGVTLINLDPNESGPDDLVGQLLIYSGDVIVAASQAEDLPPLPDILSAPISGRISGEARVAFQLVAGGLAIAQIQLAFTKPKAAMALKYVGQVINALIAGRTVPTAPSALTTT